MPKSWGMKGLTLDSIKKTPSLIPLYVCVAVGMAAAVIYPLRVLMFHPEIKCTRTRNPEPWNEYAEKQYKFYSATLDYSKIKSPAPKYQE